MGKIFLLATILFSLGAKAQGETFAVQKWAFVDELGVAQIFTLEIADTDERRKQGLMLRESLDDDKGMLFIYDTPDHWAMWMKDTLIPLDMVFLNKEKEVVFIAPNRPPHSLEHISPCNVLLEGYDGELSDNEFWYECVGEYDTPYMRTKYVVELAAGMSDRISIGDVLKKVE